MFFPSMTTLSQLGVSIFVFFFIFGRFLADSSEAKKIDITPGPLGNLSVFPS